MILRQLVGVGIFPKVTGVSSRRASSIDSASEGVAIAEVRARGAFVSPVCSGDTGWRRDKCVLCVGIPIIS